jgi:alkylation response protein AidB-like acyl-CoA dehydrogenase
MQHPSRPTEPRQETVDLAAGLVPGLAARAAGYDEADAFCHVDFDEMLAAGYTAITVPAELGGMGAGALDLVAAQSRLAEGNPATALRDANAGLLLPPSHDATLQWLGRVELGTASAPGGGGSG